MQEKKLIAGIKTVTASGAGVAPFLFALTGNLENSICIALSSMGSFIIITAIVALLNRVFKKTEIAVLSIGVSGVVLNLLSFIADKQCSEFFMIIMVVSFG